MRFSWIILGLGIVGFSSIGCGDDGSVDDGGDGTGNSGTGNAGTGNSGNGGDGTGNAGTGGSGNVGTGGSGNEGTGGTAGGGGKGGQGPEGPIETLRFVAFGDAGTGSGTQYLVADSVKTVCDAAGGCDFAIYLGDNIYDTGVDSVNDNQFQTKFELPYQNIMFPFMVSLGNHDFGGGGAGFEFMKGQYQVDYSASGMSNKFTLPALYYTFESDDTTMTPEKGGVSFFALNTNEVMYTGDNTQRLWLNGATAVSESLWKIAFGHHTYISNGSHGNAGDYEWLPIQIPIVSGENVKDFMDDSICGKVDVYFCGHDHNRQWLEPTCGTHFIVSGSAAKFTDFEHNAGDSGANPTKFQQQDDTAGFFIVEILGNTFTATSYNELGQMEFSDSFTK